MSYMRTGMLKRRSKVCWRVACMCRVLAIRNYDDGAA